MACGAIAGAASVFGNTPIDVIKSRMQVGSKDEDEDEDDEEDEDEDEDDEEDEDEDDEDDADYWYETIIS